ncbi:MAG: hypothetical protein H6581_28100 [Bacteroidia bacterium]|nr:hypothetical protein [Bacteroidia bacterium]
MQRLYPVLTHLIQFKALKQVTVFILFLLVAMPGMQAQRGGDGGMLILNILYQGERLKMISEELQTEDRLHMFTWRHYLLNSKGKQKGKAQPWIKVKNYDVFGPPPHLFYLQPHIRKRKSTPNHRLILSDGKETMTIDFMGIIQWNPVGIYEKMNEIIFKPGHYILYRNLPPQIPAGEPGWILRKQLSEAREAGINQPTDEVLIKWGQLVVKP